MFINLSVLVIAITSLVDPPWIVAVQLGLAIPRSAGGPRLLRGIRGDSREPRPPKCLAVQIKNCPKRCSPSRPSAAQVPASCKSKMPPNFGWESLTPPPRTQRQQTLECLAVIPPIGRGDRNGNKVTSRQGETQSAVIGSRPGGSSFQESPRVDPGTWVR